MNLGSIFSNAIRYPFGDYKKLLMVGIIILITGLPQLAITYGVDSTVILVLYVIELIFGILLAGYYVSVVRNGAHYSDEIPDLDFVKNFKDGLKSIVISFIYLIIPTVIVVLVIFFTGAIGASLDHIGTSLIISILVAVILYILFGILEIVAIARFAYYDDWGEALSIGTVYDDAKSIGFFNIIVFLFVMILVCIVLAVVSLLLGLIPYVGAIISYLVVESYTVLFAGNAIGLFYSEKD